MASKIPTGFLTLRAGKLNRFTRVMSTGSVREVTLSNCRIIRWDSDLEGDIKRPNEQITFSVQEIERGEPRREEEPEKIGAFSRDEELFITSFLPPEAFAQFWTAIDAPHGTTHDIHVTYKALPPRVTNIGSSIRLTDHTASVTQLDFCETIPASSVHPVVGELRSMREQLKSLTKTPHHRVLGLFCRLSPFKIVGGIQ
jgi:hypothetical protein